jgi:hypothetical protein
VISSSKTAPGNTAHCVVLDDASRNGRSHYFPPDVPAYAAVKELHFLRAALNPGELAMDPLTDM